MEGWKGWGFRWQFLAEGNVNNFYFLLCAFLHLPNFLPFTGTAFFVIDIYISTYSKICLLFIINYHLIPKRLIFYI